MSPVGIGGCEAGGIEAGGPLLPSRTTVTPPDGAEGASGIKSAIFYTGFAITGAPEVVQLLAHRITALWLWKLVVIETANELQLILFAQNRPPATFILKPDATSLKIRVNMNRIPGRPQSHDHIYRRPRTRKHFEAGLFGKELKRQREERRDPAQECKKSTSLHTL